MTTSAVLEDVLSLVTSAVSPVPVMRWEDIDEGVSPPWIAVEDSYATEEVAAIGRGCIQERGEIFVHVFTAAGTALTAARVLGETIRHALRFQNRRLASAGIIYNIEAAHPPQPGDYNDGMWSSVIVLINYRAFRAP